LTNEIKPFILQKNVISRGATSISPLLKKLILYAVYDNRAKEGKKKLSLTARQVFKMFDIKPGGKQLDKIKAIMKTSSEESIYIARGDNGDPFGFIPWFARIDYAEGKVTFTLNDELNPFFCEVGGRYHKVELERYFKLEGKYADSFYVFCLSFKYLAGKYPKKKGEWYAPISVEGLRDMLCLGDAYKDMGDLKKMIDKSLLEINEAKLGIQVDRVDVKPGKEIEGFEFHCKGYQLKIAGEAQGLDLDSLVNHEDEKLIKDNQERFDEIVADMEIYEKVAPFFSGETRTAVIKQKALEELKKELG